MNPLLIVLIILGTLIVLGIGGCVACAAIIGGTANEIDKSITDELNKNSITNEQARQIEIGATRREVERIEQVLDDLIERVEVLEGR